MIWRNLMRRKVRSLLTIVGVAIGVAAVVSLVAMGDGFYSQMNSMLSKGGADLTVRQAKAADMTLSALDEDVGRRLAAMPEVEQVYGYDPTEYAIRHFKILEGGRLTSVRQAILGKGAAKALKLRVGQSVKLFSTSFRVVGIYETGTPFEDAGLVIPLKDAQAVFKKPQQVSFFELKLRDPEKADDLKKRIESRYPDAFAAKSAEFSESSQDVQVTRSMTWGLSMIAVLVGGIGVMNTMVMSVFERTREIGVLRAVGWRRRRIILMVLMESLLLSVVGGLFGIALGIGLIQLVGLLPGIGSLFAAAYQPSLFIQAMVVALALGTVGGIYPAWRASRLSPLEALRYE
ncbi:MAG: ABC transporter permease [Actinobacteria bacterium]|nr:ABC transporter permease [Actinomycetota bacterium]